MDMDKYFPKKMSAFISRKYILAYGDSLVLLIIKNTLSIRLSAKSLSNNSRQ